MDDDGTMLQEIQEGTEANKKDPQGLKDQFLSEMLGYAEDKGRKPGWASYQYKDKYGVWPKARPQPSQPTELVKGWIKYQAIRRKATESKRMETMDKLKGMFNE
jgi:hypothetical protein